MTLAVNEIFGPTFQGEAKHLGRRCGFIRLGACNLDCSWCDTPYTWDSKRFDLKKEISPITVSDILKKIMLMRVDMVVISGGEPLLQQKKPDWLNLLTSLKNLSIEAHIETNGTIEPSHETIKQTTHFSVSPKLKSAGVSETKKRFNEKALKIFSRLAKKDKALFKFVCVNEHDLSEVYNIEQKYNLQKKDIWIMPEGVRKITIQSRLEALSQPVLDYGYQLTPRLHTLIWETERAK